MLTLHEAFLRDKELDIEGRERLTEEARELIHEEFGLSPALGRSEVDRVLADCNPLVKKLDEKRWRWPRLVRRRVSATHAEEAAFGRG